ncbi:MAG: carbohydrate kinase family protein [Lachnospiraceae bacterium]|nr:carbohydrate kinase family protein [Lachnospiraceae bacterium]
MAKFAVAGIVQVETIVRVEDIPVRYSPVTNMPDTVFTYVGGDAYNERVALKALGDEVEFFSMVGKQDLRGILWDEDFMGDGDFVLPVLESTPTAVILYDKKRQQQIFEDIKDMRDAEFNLSLFKEKIKDADAVVLANANFCRPLAAAAKEAGKLLAVNFRGFTEEKMQYNEDFFELADIIYVSDDNIVGSADEFVRKLADNYSAKIIILGQGAAGLTIFSREDELLAHYKPVKTNEIVNTSGAGNSLFSCFLHCYVSTGDAVHAVKKALLFASYKIGFMGTSVGFLKEEELEHWYRLIWGAGK